MNTWIEDKCYRCGALIRYDSDYEVWVHRNLEIDQDHPALSTLEQAKLRWAQEDEL